jgi:hypothetical protein
VRLGALKLLLGHGAFLPKIYGAGSGARLFPA